MKSLFSLLGTIFLVACGGESLPPGLLPPPLPPFTESVNEALVRIPAPADSLAGTPDPQLDQALDRAFSGDPRLEIKGQGELVKAWPGCGVNLAARLSNEKTPGEIKGRILQFAATQKGRTIALLCRYALEARPDQAIPARQWAVWLLGKHGVVSDIPTLALRLKYEVVNDDADPKALAWTAKSLAQLGNLAGIKYLVTQLKDPRIQQMAGGILIEIIRREGLDWEEGGSWEELAKKANGLLQNWQTQGRPTRTNYPEPDQAFTRELLLRLTRCRKFNLRFADDAKFVLQRCGLASIDAITTALTDKSLDIRKVALESAAALGALTKKENRNQLGAASLALLRDPILGLYAVETLGHLRYQPAIPYLIGLARGTSPDLRQTALLALGRIGAMASLPIMEATLADPGRAPEEYMAAALSLGLMKDPERARKFLEKLRSQPDVHGPTLDQFLEELTRHQNSKVTK